MKHTHLKQLAVTVLATALTSSAVAQDEAVSQLRSHLLANGGVCVVRIQGLHATTDMLGRPSEMRIVNGEVSRGAGAVLHGKADFVIPQGQSVRILDVQAGSDSKRDELKVRLAAGSSFIPVAFVLPQGSLASMSEQQLEAVVEPVLAPVVPAPAHQTAEVSAPAQLSGPRTVAQAQPQSASPTSTRKPLDAPNVVELNGILKRHGGDALIVAEGVRAAMGTPDNTPDNLIVDGIFHPQPRGMHNGMRDINLWPNSQAQFLDLSAFTDDQHDYLHLVIRGTVGSYAPFTWVFPKGQLASMSKRQIMHDIDPVVVFAAADEKTFR